MDEKNLYTASLFAAAVLGLIWKWRGGVTKLPFPPGPRGIPLLGNVLDVPRDVPLWLTFKSMAQKYGTDLTYLRVLGTDMVILNSAEAVSDLLEKRSNIYSNRPRAPMLELMGSYSWNIALVEYGNLWKSGRRLLHEFLNARAVKNFDEYQRKHAQRLLLRLVDSPIKFADHIEFAVGALTIEMTYGLKIANSDDRFLRAAVEAVEIATRALVPGNFLVDMIPILKYIPEWFPGAGFKTFARVALAKTEVAMHGPLDYVKETMKSGGRGNPSIAWSCFDRTPESTNWFDDHIIRSATATMYMSAVETTVSALQTFILAMALNPHVARRAQEELDRVVGSDRLPDFSDQENLPYISAIIKEIYRWGCPFPIGVPKQVMEDDTYKGYFIPAGATIIENVWTMVNDESIYPSPRTYDPERYIKDGKLDPSVKDPEQNVFGASRRICPGRFFATRAIFLNIAYILAVFDIEAPHGEKLEAEFNEEHILRRPAPFKCIIRPRSDASLKLMKVVCDASEH